MPAPDEQDQSDAATSNGREHWLVQVTVTCLPLPVNIDHQTAEWEHEKHVPAFLSLTQTVPQCQLLCASFPPALR